MTAPLKPLGGKAYGSIPHLPGSRLGPGDHHCHAGQEAICLTKARDPSDRIIVTEKLDGSNVAVGRIGDGIFPIIRAGYLACTSPREQHRMFAVWAMDRRDQFLALLRPGERVCGEWLALAHGTRYALAHDPFVAFDIMAGNVRMSHDNMTARCRGAGIETAAVIHDGGPIKTHEAMRLLGKFGRHGADDEVEGAVWRVERRGVFDFLAKWVRPGKVDGKFLADVSGGEDVWNWRPTPAPETSE